MLDGVHLLTLLVLILSGISDWLSDHSVRNIKKIRQPDLLGTKKEGWLFDEKTCLAKWVADRRRYFA